MKVRIPPFTSNSARYYQITQELTMASSQPTELLPFDPAAVWHLLNHFGTLIDKWQTDCRSIFQKYVYDGCDCLHKMEILRIENELKAIQKTHSLFHQYLSAAEAHKSSVCNAMQDGHDSLRVLEKANDQRKQDLGAMTALEKPRLRYNGITTVSAIIAHRLALACQKKDKKRLKANIIQADKKIREQRKIVVEAGNQYVNVKALVQWIEALLKLADIHMGSVNATRVLEKTWGLKVWKEERERRMSRVASQGLKLLICDKCNGWRYEKADEPLLKDEAI